MIFNGFNKLGLSPGAHTVKYADTCLKRRHVKQQKAQSPSTKRRRLVLKQERAINQGANEALEGDTYQSGIGHSENVDVEQVPDSIPRGNFKPVQLPGPPTVITFDLETTGLIREGVHPQITQIAAVELQSGKQFNKYVKPTVPISTAATTITGISYYNQEMKVNGIIVPSVPIKTALDEFVYWISKFKNACLVAHNGRRFDFPILVSTLKNIGAQEKISECAFIDSMSVFRKMYPHSSLKQVDLVSSLLGEKYDAHNAMDDVIALGNLIKFVNLPSSDLMAYSFAQSAVANNMAFNKAKALNVPSLNPLLCSGVIKKPTADNIAGSGLNINHLKLVHSRGGEDALKDVFISKNSEGLPRVSNNKKVLEEIIPQIARYFENH